MFITKLTFCWAKTDEHSLLRKKQTNHKGCQKQQNRKNFHWGNKEEKTKNKKMVESVCVSCEIWCFYLDVLIMQDFSH